MKTYKIWLLNLILPVRFGRLLTGILLFAVLYPFFSLGAVGNSSDSGPILFFSMILAYIIPVFSFITAKVEEALAELRPILSLSDGEFVKAQRKLDSATLQNTAMYTMFGMLLGFAHLSFIEGSGINAITEMFSNRADFITAIGALSVWIVMTTVISMLIQQTALFARLGKNKARVSLLNSRKLLPFSRVSSISSLSIIGALALMPLMSVDSGLNFSESLPGAIATLGPLLVIFIIPVWPVHRRLATLKEHELNALDNKISNIQNDSGGIDLSPETLRRINPLLNYRQEISRVSTWPYDGGAVTRLAFYLIIPPLTWAGAALIEQIVDSLV